MKRKEIIQKIGTDFHTENIENGEFSYAKAIGRPIEGHKFLDLRFESGNVSILVETKANKFKNADKDQLFKYMELEKEFTKNKIIGILHNTTTGETIVWKNDELLNEETTINTFQYYIDLFMLKRVNDKENVVKATYQLNTELHKAGIPEDLRSQFVGCLLVAVNNGLEWSDHLKTSEILYRIKEILSSKIEDNAEKKIKTDLLINILKKQVIAKLKEKEMLLILDIIDKQVLPFINSKSANGEDLLNLFFTTFNKYVGKKD